MLFDAFQDLTVARKVRGSPATLSDSFFLCPFFLLCFWFCWWKINGRNNAESSTSFKLCVLVSWSFVCLNLVHDDDEEESSSSSLCDFGEILS